MKTVTITLENGQTFDTLCSSNYTDRELVEKWEGKMHHGPTANGMQWMKAVKVTVSSCPEK